MDNIDPRILYVAILLVITFFGIVINRKIAKILSWLNKINENQLYQLILSASEFMKKQKILIPQNCNEDETPPTTDPEDGGN